MFNRLLIKNLEEWAAKKGRKPLILRGARQVGKTTLIKLFSTQFPQFIHLDLDKYDDRSLFKKKYSLDDLVSAIFFQKKLRKEIRTLIFIDEIQSSPEAVEYLKQFAESQTENFVIAAGSLLDTLLHSMIKIPVGRVEYLAVHPCSFVEFLGALDEPESLSLLQEIPFPVHAHEPLLRHFRFYTMIGGMPEAVNRYAEQKDLTALSPLFDNLLTSYMDDVEKYASGKTSREVIRAALRNCFPSAGSRIKFTGFAGTAYKSREMGEALRTLEKAFILQLVYPCSSTILPLFPNMERSPKLQLLDTGVVNYFSGMQSSIMNSAFIDQVYNGRIAEHITGQELLSLNSSPLGALHFWSREKKNSNAEVDFIRQAGELILPIEVKSGAAGTLRSLHQFMEEAPHSYAVRISSSPFSIEEIKTASGKKYRLMNLPFYLLCVIDKYIKRFLIQ